MGEIFVNYFQELFSKFCGHCNVEGWVVPDSFSFSVFVLFVSAALGLIGSDCAGGGTGGGRRALKFSWF